MLEEQNINKRKEELQLELEIFNKDAAAELNAQLREADLKVSLARNNITIAKRQEDVKLSVAKTQSAEIVARKEMERKTLKNEADNNLKLLSMQSCA